ncbi:MAG: hypothetical protein Ct9H300mP7_6630 [Verrucomicrobiota bacterium]|nr:MAG: hypothetical protein Ct9H300mP7_6630 [Verrucomicrobiota bacterium]
MKKDCHEMHRRFLLKNSLVIKCFNSIKKLTVFHSNRIPIKKKGSNWVFLVNKSMIKCVTLAHLGKYPPPDQKTGKKDLPTKQGQAPWNIPPKSNSKLGKYRPTFGERGKSPKTLTTVL